MPVEVWWDWRQAALEGIGTCPISSSSNRAIAEASLEEIIKSGEKVKTSGMPPKEYTALEFHRLGFYQCQSKPF